ncbi:MAG: hypothetical protein JKX97_07090 [Candidatus Lindowbacteria bacterium]|nr:hypothetical protein [Candidatus Lindowbacteria bacterium]
MSIVNGILVVGAILSAFLTIYICITLREVTETLKTYRLMEPKINSLLENLDAVSKQAATQATRLDEMTSDAKVMVDNVKGTVELYNKTVAKPAIFIASMAKAVQGMSSLLSKKK